MKRHFDWFDLVGFLFSFVEMGYAMAHALQPVCFTLKIPKDPMK